LSLPTIQHEHARVQLRRVSSEIESDREKHDNRTFPEKYAWLHSNHIYAPQLAALEHGLSAMEKVQKIHGIGKSKQSLGSAKYERLQFRTVDDMKGLSWLTYQALQLAGGITQQSVIEFKSQRMGPDENPLQAATRAIRMAKVIHDSGYDGFDFDYELHDLFTNEDLKGGAFFSPSLYKSIQKLVKMHLALKAQNSKVDYVAEREVWIRVAQEEFVEIRGRDSTLDRAIQNEVRNRHKVDGTHGVYQPKGKSQHSLGNEPKPNPNQSNQAGNNTSAKLDDKGKGKAQSKGCLIHGSNSKHSTDDCREVHKLRDQLRKEGASKDNNAGFDGSRVNTVIQGAGTDLKAKGAIHHALMHNACHSIPMNKTLFVVHVPQ
jgi:hypothetical protein